MPEEQGSRSPAPRPGKPVKTQPGAKPAAFAAAPAKRPGGPAPAAPKASPLAGTPPSDAPEAAAEEPAAGLPEEAGAEEAAAEEEAPAEEAGEEGGAPAAYPEEWAGYAVLGAGKPAAPSRGKIKIRARAPLSAEEKTERRRKQLEEDKRKSRIYLRNMAIHVALSMTMLLGGGSLIIKYREQLGGCVRKIIGQRPPPPPQKREWNPQVEASNYIQRALVKQRQWRDSPERNQQFMVESCRECEKALVEVYRALCLPAYRGAESRQVLISLKNRVFQVFRDAIGALTGENQEHWIERRNQLREEFENRVMKKMAEIDRQGASPAGSANPSRPASGSAWPSASSSPSAGPGPGDTPPADATETPAASASPSAIPDRDFGFTPGLSDQTPTAEETVAPSASASPSASPGPGLGFTPGLSDQTPTAEETAAPATGETVPESAGPAATATATASPSGAEESD